MLCPTTLLTTTTMLLANAVVNAAPISDRLTTLPIIRSLPLKQLEQSNPTVHAQQDKWHNLPVGYGSSKIKRDSIQNPENAPDEHILEHSGYACLDIANSLINPAFFGEPIESRFVEDDEYDEYESNEEISNDYYERVVDALTDIALSAGDLR